MPHLLQDVWRAAQNSEGWQSPQQPSISIVLLNLLTSVEGLHMNVVIKHDTGLVVLLETIGSTVSHEYEKAEEKKQWKSVKILGRNGKERKDGLFQRRTSGTLLTKDYAMNK